MSIARAVYRMQLSKAQTFAQVGTLTSYLKNLGISHLYASPIFQASEGSEHGYDVHDPTCISSELGGESAFRTLAGNLGKAGIGIILDFVPNHMGVAQRINWRWDDVLSNGAKSSYFRHFDLDWHSKLAARDEKILLPILEAPYGQMLAEHRLLLEYESGLRIKVGTSVLPLRRESWKEVLQVIGIRSAPPTFKTSAAQLFARDQVGETVEADISSFLGTLLEDDRERVLFQSALDEINHETGPVASRFLHLLLEGQHYRLAHWKAGVHETNFRRFFAINTLIGVRCEDETVFNDLHSLLRRLIEENLVQGIRVDHIDGLRVPVEYLNRLRKLGEENTSAKITIVTEKILGASEYLPADWPVDGTTGYEFIASLIGLFMPHDFHAAWTKIYHDFTGVSEASAELAYHAKCEVADRLFSSSFDVLARDLDALLEDDLEWRDLTFHSLRKSLICFVASLPVYRTYITGDAPVSLTDRSVIDQAVNDALKRNKLEDPAAFRLLRSIFLGEESCPALPKGALTHWICRVQQMTGAVMAKAIEDTHFYRYVRMIAANEVGNSPERFGTPVETFHETNLHRAASRPASWLCTSTHDTKFGEDVRARLFALAELPEEFDVFLKECARHSAGFKTSVNDRVAPNANEEYLLYQVLLATWPFENEGYSARIKQYFRKAVNEAAQNSSWSFPDEDWLAACDRFVDHLLDSESGLQFREKIEKLAARIAGRGMVFSLAQLVLKLTSPGVPDIYQGSEVWNLNLVDPDNRRAVDFEVLKKLAEGLERRSVEDMFFNWQDGAVKLHILRAVLQYREQNPLVFEGDYQPLFPAGVYASEVVAFSRTSGAGRCVVIAPKALRNFGDTPPVSSAWQDTRLPLPGSWRNVLTGTRVQAGEGGLLFADIMAPLPVAVLHLEDCL